MTLLFRPIKENNAIESCFIIIQTQQPIDADRFKVIQEVARAVASEVDLPSVVSSGIPAPIMGLMSMLNAQPAPLTTLIAQRFAANGEVTTELRCEAQGVVLTVRDYTSWKALRELIEKTILKLLPLYLDGLPAIRSVRIQYEDKFVANQNGPVSASELLRPDCPWVAQHNPNTDMEWHSHYGLFIGKGENQRELVNVNVTVLNQPDSAEIKRLADLTILVGEQFDIPGMPPLIVEPARSSEVIGGILDEVHYRHKTILQEVLSDPYLDAIGCETP